MGTSTFALVLRLVVSLGVVLVLVRLSASLLQRTGAGVGGRRRRGPAEVEVLLRQPLGRRASLGVVRTGDRALVLGITEHSITLLGEGDPDVLVPIAPDAPRTAPRAGGAPSSSRPTWMAVLDGVRDRTVRRT